MLSKNLADKVAKREKAAEAVAKDEESLRLCRQLLEIGREGFILPEITVNHFDKSEARWRLQTVAMLKAAYKYLVPVTSRPTKQPSNKNDWVIFIAPFLKYKITNG